MNTPPKELTLEPRPAFGHPLNALPWLRRVPQSLPRDLFYTFLLAIVVSAAFSFITKLNVPSQSLPSLLYINSIFSLAIGYAIHGLSLFADWALRFFRPTASDRLRLAFDVLASFVGAAFGYKLAAHLLGLDTQAWVGMILGVIWVVVLITALTMAESKRAQTELTLERERGARIEAQRVMTAARLQLLQAQIEPHFLFNTLANVSSLIEIEPKQARKMLDELTVLLRASLDSTRRSRISLRKELQVIAAYLSVLKVRMGNRLQFNIDAPEDLMETEVPSMLLQPIVENAVKHGIEPRLEGGIVRVQIRRQLDRLELDVLDNGVGFANPGEENIGLGAVRERLAMQFEKSAELHIERIDDWTRVAIRIPLLNSEVSL